MRLRIPMLRNQRSAAALLSVLVMLAPALVATPARAEDQPIASKLIRSASNDLDQAKLIYRHQHTVMRHERDGRNHRKDPLHVSWDRNVEAFRYTTPKNVELILVAPSIGPQSNNKNDAPIGIYRADQSTGELYAVDKHGERLRDEDGKLVDWRTASLDQPSPPTDVWTLTPDQPWDSKRKRGGAHSEWVGPFFLAFDPNDLDKDVAPELHKRVTEALSELPPCSLNPNHCSTSLTGRTVEDQVNGGTVDFALTPNLRALYHTVEKGKGAVRAAKKAQQKAWTEAGMPTGKEAASKVAALPGLATPGSRDADGPATEALAPGADLGGIDFTTLELRYLAEGEDGQLQYAFSASSVGPGQPNRGDGALATVHASDAFFVWLSLSPSTFWVNLNPNEPDRIINAKLGTTDVGRILLQADLQMKKTVAKLIHPNTSLGREFWRGVRGEAQCLNMRQWIVPAPATVYEEDGGLYVVDAPLRVKSETEHIKNQGAASCATPDPTMENLFHHRVLPELEKAVNQAPEYADLRRVYLSRVTAEWYRQRHSFGYTLSGMINTGDVSAWPALRQWSPQQVFDQYVNSFKKKEFNVTRRVALDGNQYEATYTYGGVDFTQVPLNRTSRKGLQHDHADLPDTVRRSFQQVTTDAQGRVWLGGNSKPVPLPFPNAPEPATSNPLLYGLSALPLVIWLAAGAVLLLRRRRTGTMA